MLKYLSGGLVVLLAFLAIWGQCAACPLIIPQKECCNRHAGHCQMPSPKQQPEQPPCPDQALAPVAHHDAQASVVDLVAPVAVSVAIEPSVVAAWPDVTRNAKLDTGPPDLYLRNLVLLV